MCCIYVKCEGIKRTGLRFDQDSCNLQLGFVLVHVPVIGLCQVIAPSYRRFHMLNTHTHTHNIHHLHIYHTHHSRGGITLTIPDRRPNESIDSINSLKSLNSSMVGRNTGIAPPLAYMLLVSIHYKLFFRLSLKLSE